MTTAELRNGRRTPTGGSAPRRAWLPTLGVLVVSAVVFSAVVAVALATPPLGAVGDWLLRRIPVVVPIAFLSTALVAALGAAIGTIAAHRGRTGERVLSLLLVAGHVIPVFWVAVAVAPRLTGLSSPFPAVEYVTISDSVPGWLASVSVPLIALTLGSAAAIARPIATTWRDLLPSDLVRTLRSRGLPHHYILRVHVWRRYAHASVQPLSLHVLGLVGSMLAMEAVVAHQGGLIASTALGAAPVLITLTLFAVCLVAVVAIDLVRGTWMGMPRARERSS